MLFVASPPSHHGYTGICLPKIFSYKFIFTFISATCHLTLMTTHIIFILQPLKIPSGPGDTYSYTWIMKLSEGTM